MTVRELLAQFAHLSGNVDENRDVRRWVGQLCPLYLTIDVPHPIELSLALIDLAVYVFGHSTVGWTHLGEDRG